MTILNASHLKKYYGKDESLVKALDDVNVSVEKGQFAAAIGTSGSGKSTLLNMLGGLDVPTSGRVQIENNNIEAMSEEQLTVFRRKRIGFIFQNYNLIPYLTLSLVRLSRFPVGSSARMMAGLDTKALAMATLCCCPPDRWLG